MVLAFGVRAYHAPATHELPPGGALSSGLNPPKGRSFQRTCQRAVSELVGASEETGGVFDPLGLATDEVRWRGETRPRVNARVWSSASRFGERSDMPSKIDM